MKRGLFWLKSESFIFLVQLTCFLRKNLAFMYLKIWQMFCKLTQMTAVSEPHLEYLLLLETHHQVIYQMHRSVQHIYLNASKY